MKFYITVFSLLILPLSMTSVADEQEPIGAGNITLLESTISAEPKVRVPPRYPRNASRKGMEGWVRFSFVVGENGDVIDPIITSSSGIASFEREALRAIEQWQYTPATRNGKPIEQSQNQVQLDFRLQKVDGKVSARRRFIQKHSEANEALQAGNIELAKELIDKMENGKVWNHFEDTWFWLLKSAYYKAKNNEKRELSTLRSALRSKDLHKVVGNELYIDLLKQKFVLEVKATRYVDALATFAIIEQLAASDKTNIIETLTPYAEQVRKIVRDDPFIVVRADMNEDGQWWHELSRSRFMFSDIQGELKSMELRCDNKRERYSIAEANEWIIPESWGRCAIFVTGDPNANYNLVEIKSKV